jgi:Uma2 family endonuclease
MIQRVGTISIDEFNRMIAAGYFDRVKQRVDLIRGELVYMSPASPMHDEVLTRMESWSEKWAPTVGYRKRSEKGVELSPLVSVPEPDVVWVKDKDYMTIKPQAADVGLVIEVAKSSLDDDRRELAPLFAEAGIPEYWIVNCLEHCIEVHRQPAGEEYAEQFSVDVGERISPLIAPQAVLDVAALFARRG